MRFRGFHADAAIPFKPGQLAVIPKGTPIQTSKGMREAKRTYVITVDHLLPGRSISCYDALTNRAYHSMLEKQGFDFAPIEKARDENSPEYYRGNVALVNPEIRWSGKDGWNAVDINYILTANGIEP